MGSWSELPRPHLLSHQHQQPPGQATSLPVSSHSHTTPLFPIFPIYQPFLASLRPLKALNPSLCCIPTTSGASQQSQAQLTSDPSPRSANYNCSDRAIARLLNLLLLTAGRAIRSDIPGNLPQFSLLPVIKHSALEACSNNRPCSRPSTSLFRYRSGSLTMTP
jgi:hypothetical protein